MIEIALLFLVLLSAFGIGNILLHSFDFKFSDVLEESVFSIGLGVGCLGYSILILGLFHGLYIFAIYGLLIAGALIAIKPILTFAGKWNSVITSEPFNNRVCLSLAFVAVLILLVSFLKSFVPPIDSDPLAYHLELPKRFLNHHEIGYFPYTANSTFPLLIEMLYTIGLALKGTSLAQMIHLSLGAVSAFAIFVFARKILRFEFALFSAVVFLTIPGIFHQMPTANNDIGLTFFFLLQVYSVWKWIESSETKWLALAGCFAGFGLSVKLIAGLGIASTGIIILIFGDKKNLKKLLSEIIIYGVFLTLTSFVWYLRSYLLTGNPVFPFFPSLFGGVGHAYSLGKHGVGKSFVDFLLSFWNIIAKPASFGGRGNQLGPLFLLMFPSLLIARNLQSKVFNFLLMYGVSYYIFWFLGPQNLRFFFPITAVFSILISVFLYFVISRVHRVVKWIVIFLVFVCLAFNVLLAVYFLRADYKVALGLEKRENFLRQSERSYAMAEYVNKTLPKNSQILSQEIRGFYFEPDLSRYEFFLQREKLPENVSMPELVDAMKKRGIPYLLLIESPIKPSAHEPIVEPFVGELKVMDFNSTKGEPSRYRLLRVKST